MSVPQGDRDTAEPEYIQNARNLVIYTMQKTRKWPQRVNRDLGDWLKSLAKEVYGYAQAGRSIWPTDSGMAYERRKAFQSARASLKAMIGALEITAEVYPDCKKYLPAWAAMAAQEIKLLGGVLDSDRRRFRF